MQNLTDTTSQSYNKVTATAKANNLGIDTKQKGLKQQFQSMNADGRSSRDVFARKRNSYQVDNGLYASH